MKKKIVIVFFCVTLSVCAIYGGLRYSFSSGTGQMAMADMLEEETSVDDTGSCEDLPVQMTRDESVQAMQTRWIDLQLRFVF